MQTLVFRHTDDLPHIDAAQAVVVAAEAAGYRIDVRHAHAVVVAWRANNGKPFLTDDGWETSVPAIPTTGTAFLDMLRSFCIVLPAP